MNDHGTLTNNHTIMEFSKEHDLIVYQLNDKTNQNLLIALKMYYTIK